LEKIIFKTIADQLPADTKTKIAEKPCLKILSFKDLKKSRIEELFEQVDIAKITGAIKDCEAFERDSMIMVLSTSSRSGITISGAISPHL
jgi:hypothetical protein